MILYSMDGNHCDQSFLVTALASPEDAASTVRVLLDPAAIDP